MARDMSETGTPLRKRRRPALSCVECRRRKIKCDREEPCNHCKKSKNAICVYKDAHPAVANSRSSLSNQNSESLDQHEGAGGYLSHQDSSPHTSKDSALSEGGLDSTSNSSIDDSRSLNLVDRTKSWNAALNQALPDGMNLSPHELRGNAHPYGSTLQLGTFNDVIIQDGMGPSQIRQKFFNDSQRTPVTDLQGNISKTRFFGQSHW